MNEWMNGTLFLRLTYEQCNDMPIAQRIAIIPSSGSPRVDYHVSPLLSSFPLSTHPKSSPRMQFVQTVMNRCALVKWSPGHHRPTLNSQKQGGRLFRQTKDRSSLPWVERNMKAVCHRAEWSEGGLDRGWYKRPTPTSEQFTGGVKFKSTFGKLHNECVKIRHTWR